MNTSKKHILVFILLSIVTFSATTQNLLAIRTGQAGQQTVQQKTLQELEKQKLEELKQLKEKKQKEKQKRTLKQTWSKVVRLKWSELDKKDVWNIFVTTATVGGVVGGGYLIGCHVIARRNTGADDQARLEQERRDREFALGMQQQWQQEVHDRPTQNSNSNFRPAQPQRQRPQYRDPRPPATTERVVLAEGEECSVCMDDYDVLREINELTCKHRFCINCLRGQITTALGDMNFPICPHHDCNHQLTEREIKLVTGNNIELLQRLDQASLRHFVNSQLGENQHAIHCPGPNCQMFWVREGNDRFTFMCNECQTPFCTDCHKDHAQTITCEQARQHERENSNWIQEHTRPCPQCHVRVEKNRGCNHMTCSQCRYHFCWVCGQQFAIGLNNHEGFYECTNQPIQGWPTNR